MYVRRHVLTGIRDTDKNFALCSPSPAVRVHVKQPWRRLSLNRSPAHLISDKVSLHHSHAFLRFRGKFQIIPQKLTLKQTCWGKMILLLLLKKLAYYLSHWGKIQGDGRKFLDRFESYSGSQISSHSLNEVHIYQLQPKSATKSDLFHIFCLWLFRVGVTDCKWRTKPTKYC